jgi:hypothetical protein
VKADCRDCTDAFRESEDHLFLGRSATELSRRDKAKQDERTGRGKKQ